MILRGNFPSKELHSSTNISIFIADEIQGKGPFRVIYLLHGLHGDQGTWLDNTMLPVYAKGYNAVFVMPEAGRSFYLNLKYGRRYYDYVSDELPRIVERFFNISSKREDTAVMGCSMGGYGSLFLALTKPDQYGFCGAISSACLYFKPILDALGKDPGPYLETGEEAKEIYTDLLCTYGDGLAYRKDYDIVELIKNFPKDKSKPRIYATCGTQDDLRKDNLGLSNEIKGLEFDFTYEEWAGGHDWYFFNEALQKTLEKWTMSNEQ